MRRTYLIVLALLVVPAVLIAGRSAVGQGTARRFRATLTGGSEVPAVSSTGGGTLTVQIAPDNTMEYELTYSGLEGAATLFAHIHFGQTGVNGGVMTFLCGGGGKPDCPDTGGTVAGTVVAADIIGPAGQGIAAMELAEAAAAIRSGLAYANVHTDKHPGGELRGQLSGRRR